MGVGGIGVSALAEMARHAGAEVSGCDKSCNECTRRLTQKGIRIEAGHDPKHVESVDLLVYSSAVPESHPERLAAGNRQEKRGEFLARFMNASDSVGVSGTHGKTTTSWLLSHVLIAAGMDPCVFVGGLVAELPEGNYRIGSGPFVAELDESDASFLYPRLKIAVVTNVESDHLSHYQTKSALFDAFRRFAAGVRESGVLVAGTDDPGAAKLFDEHVGKKISFGISGETDLRARVIAGASGATRFEAEYKNAALGEFVLPLPGLHNVKNALAALAVALELGVDADTARRALANVCGVGRRMERLGTVGRAVVYSDYAHHPTEVAAAIAGVRQAHSGKVLVVFQPHLYTRTRDYALEFGKALAAADAALVADIYPAREEPIPGVTSQLVVDAGRELNPAVAGPYPLEQIEDETERMAGDFEAVVMMGAGSIDDVARRFVRERTSGAIPSGEQNA